MKYTCRAVISYEVIIEADSVEDAEIEVFEKLADDVTAGTIRIDLFDNNEGGADYRFPKLDFVDITYKDPKNGNRVTHTVARG